MCYIHICPLWVSSNSKVRKVTATICYVLHFYKLATLSSVWFLPIPL